MEDSFIIEEFEDDFLETDLSQEDGLTEPEAWTILTALDRVQQTIATHPWSDKLWEVMAHPLHYLRERLGVTDMQILFLAILAERGGVLSWGELSKVFRKSRLSLMAYAKEMDELLAKRWVVKKDCFERRFSVQGFGLAEGVLEAWQEDKEFVPEKLDNLDMQQFMKKLERYLEKKLQRRNESMKDIEMWLMLLVEANPQLPFCMEVLRLKEKHDRVLLLLMAYDYAQWAGSDREGLDTSDLDHLFSDDDEPGFLLADLRDGSHILMERNVIEHKCEDGVANTEHYVFTQEAKERLFRGYVPSCSKSRRLKDDLRSSLKSCKEVAEKPMYYNPQEERQIARLTELLSQQHLDDIQRRLKAQGMRQGVACLFHGAPGTGKTETVLQIARQTGRDILQVDIAGMRDKYVGESEKNIKRVFSHYRSLCKNSEVLPILFFNEADGIFGRRVENVQQGVDRMDNAMQNIILQELETLDGVLIATTNLTSNLDSAFERRFLFKVEFKKPSVEVKTRIWTSMLKGIRSEEAALLAETYDLSGGQIENIARKRTMDYVLSGEETGLAELKEYCRQESLQKQDKRQTVGFQLNKAV